MNIAVGGQVTSLWTTWQWTSFSVKCNKFFDYQGNCQFFKKTSFSWSYSLHIMTTVSVKWQLWTKLVILGASDML